MDSNSKKIHNNSGFTLVELAFVIVIIGLIIGAVIKGLEVVRNAQLSSLVAKVKTIEAGARTFKQSYNYLPGDLPNPGSVLQNCTTPCSRPNNGNGLVWSGDAVTACNGPDNLGAAYNNYFCENDRFFMHLAAANLLNGIVTDVNPPPATEIHPRLDIGGFLTMDFTTGAPANINGMIGTNNFSAGHYLVATGDFSTAITTNASLLLTPSQAFQVDRKMDDGSPMTGRVRPAGASGATGCEDGGDYNALYGGYACGMYFKIM